MPFILSILVVKALYFITRKHTNLRYLPPQKKKSNLVKFVLPRLQTQAAQDILQLLLRSEPTPQCHCYTPISSNGFSEKLSGLLSSL